METERADRGRANRARAQGAKWEKLGAQLGDLDPALLEWADGFIFGDVWDRPGLAFEERMLVAITSLATQGATPQLRNYFYGALEEGIPAEKINEALLMLVVYVGFPTALDAVVLWKQVLQSVEEK